VNEAPDSCRFARKATFPFGSAAGASVAESMLQDVVRALARQAAAELYRKSSRPAAAEEQLS
jgi:hypothetical protein